MATLFKDLDSVVVDFHRTSEFRMKKQKKFLDLSAISAINTSLPAFSASVDTHDNVPKAYLNYIYFDENYANPQFGYEEVTSEGHNKLQRLSLEIESPGQGYLFVYVANESAVPSAEVFFDDLTIIHQATSTDLQVTHASDYYPFGMPFNSYENEGLSDILYLYQGKELEEEVNLYDFHARLYDPATGRFMAADPMGQFASPYNGMGNNPAMMIDPDGKWGHIVIGAIVGGWTNLIRNWDNIDNVWDWMWYHDSGAVVGAAAALTGGAVAGAAGGGAGGAVAGGAAGGAVGGSGNSWINGASFNDGLQAGGYGAAGGAVGGGVGSAIGGGAGAFFGGVSSDATSQVLTTGEVDLSQSVLSGGLSYGLYHGTSFGSYKTSGLDSELNYRQFAVMKADFQRSRFWKREYGGVLLKDGGVYRTPSQNRNADNVNIDYGGYSANEIKAIYHTHWGKDGKIQNIEYYNDSQNNFRNRVARPFNRATTGTFKFSNSKFHDYNSEFSSYTITPDYGTWYNPNTLGKGISPIYGSIGNPFYSYFYYNFR